MTVDAAEIVTLRVVHPFQLRIPQEIIVAPTFRRPPMFLDNSACERDETFIPFLLNLGSKFKFRIFRKFFEIQISKKSCSNADEKWIEAKEEEKEEEKRIYFFFFFLLLKLIQTHTCYLNFQLAWGNEAGIRP